METVGRDELISLERVERSIMIDNEMEQNWTYASQNVRLSNCKIKTQIFQYNTSTTPLTEHTSLANGRQPRKNQKLDLIRLQEALATVN